jgi:hypothetical protein
MALPDQRWQGSTRPHILPLGSLLAWVTQLIAGFDIPMSHFRIVEVSRPPMSQVSDYCLV